MPAGVDSDVLLQDAAMGGMEPPDSPMQEQADFTDGRTPSGCDDGGTATVGSATVVDACGSLAGLDSDPTYKQRQTETEQHDHDEEGFACDDDEDDDRGHTEHDDRDAGARADVREVADTRAAVAAQEALAAAACLGPSGLERRLSPADDIPPRALLVETPNAWPECAGVYMLEDDETANGCPLWKRVDGETYLYSSPYGQWMIGGPSERKKRFNCSTAWIYCSTVHRGVPPHQVRGIWERWDGMSFQHDSDIVVVAAPYVARDGSPSVDDVGSGSIANAGLPNSSTEARAASGAASTAASGAAQRKPPSRQPPSRQPFSSRASSGGGPGAGAVLASVKTRRPPPARSPERRTSASPPPAQHPPPNRRPQHGALASASAAQRAATDRSVVAAAAAAAAVAAAASPQQRRPQHSPPRRASSAQVASSPRSASPRGASATSASAAPPAASASAPPASSSPRTAAAAQAASTNGATASRAGSPGLEGSTRQRRSPSPPVAAAQSSHRRTASSLRPAAPAPAPAVAAPPPEPKEDLSGSTEAARQRKQRTAVLAERWAASMPAAPIGAATVAYPRGASVDLPALVAAASQSVGVPLAIQDAGVRRTIIQEMECGAFGQLALRVLKAFSADLGARFSWKTGRIRSFIAAVFAEYQQPMPPDDLLNKAFQAFDKGRQSSLDAFDCLCWADAVMRAMLWNSDAMERDRERERERERSGGSLRGSISRGSQSHTGSRSSDLGSQRQLSTAIADWDAQDVGHWASRVLGLPPEVGEVLASEEISGTVLVTLTEADIEALGIGPFGRRRQLLLGVQSITGATPPAAQSIAASQQTVSPSAQPPATPNRERSSPAYGSDDSGWTPCTAVPCDSGAATRQASSPMGEEQSARRAGPPAPEEPAQAMFPNGCGSVGAIDIAKGCSASAQSAHESVAPGGASSVSVVGGASAAGGGSVAGGASAVGGGSVAGGSGQVAVASVGSLSATVPGVTASWPCLAEPGSGILRPRSPSPQLAGSSCAAVSPGASCVSGTYCSSQPQLVTAATQMKVGSSPSLFPPPPAVTHGSLQLGIRGVAGSVQLSSPPMQMPEVGSRPLLKAPPPPPTTTVMRGGVLREALCSARAAWPGDATAPPCGVPPSLLQSPMAAVPPDTARGRSCSPVMCRISAGSMVASSVHPVQHQNPQQQHGPYAPYVDSAAAVAAQLSPRPRPLVVAPSHHLQPQQLHATAPGPHMVVAASGARLGPLLVGQNVGRRTIGL